MITSAGIARAATVADLKSKLGGAGSVYDHLDMDVHDALEVRTDASAIPGGPGVEEVRAALTAIANIKALAITGLDPAAPDAGRAADIAIEYVLAIAGDGA